MIFRDFIIQKCEIFFQYGNEKSEKFFEKNFQFRERIFANF